MAIEKMTLVSVEGQLRKVNKTLIRCCESRCFHIIPYNHEINSSFSSQSFKSLKIHNHYAPLVKRALYIAEALNINLGYCEHDDIEYSSGGDFSDYFHSLEKRLNKLISEKEKSTDILNQFKIVLSQVEKLDGLDSNFEEIFALKFIKVRFGRIPADNFSKLKYFDDKTFIFQPFEKQGDYIWGVYFMPNGQSEAVDALFKSLYFERVRYPGYLKGTADDAKTHITSQIEAESKRLEVTETEILDLRDEIIETFSKAYCKLRILHDSYELRENAAVINNKFFISGYIPASELKKFTALIEDVETVQVQAVPYTRSAYEQPPIRLKNNRFTKPFEMFVNMYGLPGYGRIDPTPFVAVTYFLIYGIMFGDLGQGLVVSLLGFLLSRLKRVKLGYIITRIGISSAFFGILYGSVFGREDIIEPIFMHKSVYEALGLIKMPKDIFEVSSFLLLGALAAGVLIILITITMNIAASLRTRDFKEGVLGSNGFVGLIFYSSVVAGAGTEIGLGIKIFTPFYVAALIILPLILLFFKEPIASFFRAFTDKRKQESLKKSTEFVHAVEKGADKKPYAYSHTENDFDLQSLIECEYIKYQYGSMPLESYEKLKYFDDRSFFFFPFESESNYIKGVYIAAIDDFPAIDKLMESIGFHKEMLPQNKNDAENEDETDITYAKKKSGGHSIGGFIIEGVIELFENALTYLTNTMSFLRIGGFVLSHAGLMLVVNILAEKAGAPGDVGWILTQIIGNVIVIGMEGFLVGIQVLRLEFYEMFGRFHKSTGKPFKPIVIDFTNTD